MGLHRLTALLVAAALVPVPVTAAAKYALIVGIGDFAPPGRITDGYAVEIPALEGPRHDAEELRQLLEKDPNFQGRIVTLIDKEATKAAILSNLRDTVAKLKSGDYFFFYVSTHGTSPFDPTNPLTGNLLGPETGALIPYDVRSGTPGQILQSLIVGTRDIRPVLSGVPSGAVAFVVFDSCFSGDTARSVSTTNRFASKYAELKLSAEEMAMLGEKPGETSEWPYSNVMYLSAASKSEQAKDIRRQDFATFKTVDGKPHGAFTNALLLGLSGRADLDHDQVITHGELFQYCRREVERNFPHKPQMQSPMRGSLEKMPVFGARAVPDETASPAANERAGSKARVLLDANVPAPIAAAVRKMDGVETARSGTAYDLLLRASPDGGMDMVHPSSDLIYHYSAEETAALLERVRYYWVAKQLVEVQFADQRFNVTIETLLDGRRGHGEFHKDQMVRFFAGTDRAVPFSLLLDIDAGGNATVLYKGSLNAGKDQGIGTDNKVVHPFGVEFVKFLAYPAKPSFWDAIQAGLVYGPSAPELRQILEAVHSKGAGRSETVVKIVTFAR